MSTFLNCTARANSPLEGEALTVFVVSGERRHMDMSGCTCANSQLCLAQSRKSRTLSATAELLRMAIKSKVFFSFL